ncbi:AbrB/MazE/SpoVT family DNA-binding domain-containing protein [Candidatus Peregrinibacteria bacterium]|nr:AbrB/MazE/SpoVT family DNA-binding domain-containing protein [Candidatus Peregrinibacteria bacterium]
MTTVSLSTKFQIVIPKEIREAISLNPGTRIEIVPYENRIELIPLKPIKELKGFLKGMNTIIKR